MNRKNLANRKLEINGTCKEAQSQNLPHLASALATTFRVLRTVKFIKNVHS